jgi:hypothetical protein
LRGGVVYELPFGKASPGCLHGFASKLAGGWTTSTIIRRLRRSSVHRQRRLLDAGSGTTSNRKLQRLADLGWWGGKGRQHL